MRLLLDYITFCFDESGSYDSVAGDKNDDMGRMHWMTRLWDYMRDGGDVAWYDLHISNGCI